MIDVGGPKFFACDECSIVEQFERRMEFAIKHPEYGYFQFDHCGCEKLNDEFWQCGYCEDAWVDMPKHHEKGKRKTGRAYRRWIQVQRFNQKKDTVLRHNTRSMYLGVDRSGLPAFNEWTLCKLGIDDGNVRYAYIKRTKSSKYKKFYKDYSNRVVRRSTGSRLKGNQYRKLFDLWWTID